MEMMMVLENWNADSHDGTYAVSFIHETENRITFLLFPPLFNNIMGMEYGSWIDEWDTKLLWMATINQRKFGAASKKLTEPDARSDFLALHLLACMLPPPFHCSHLSNFPSNLRGFLQKIHMHPLPFHCCYKSIHSFALPLFSIEPLLPCNFYGLIWELQLLLLFFFFSFFLGWKKGPERW